MPRLTCNAINCIYNCEHLCSKSVININDDSDFKKCLSFHLAKQVKEDDYKIEAANLNNVNQYISIECSAKRCFFNNCGLCVSEHVNISGPSSKKISETKCQTFKL